MPFNLTTYQSLFKGREDVYAKSMEKDGKIVYMPSYDVNWQEYAAHKAKGGSMKDFDGKSYSKLTDANLLKHVNGRETIGIYPLLPDNTSWFIAADFDETAAANNNWLHECKGFIKECEKHELPVYLERSHSGKGGRVWLFFEAPYLAEKSRKIFSALLKNSMASSAKSDINFDRFSPNQDVHSGKGFGNLIALPLQKQAVEKGNSCFINSETLEPFTDQWAFLETVKRVSVARLDEVLNEFL